MQKVSAILLFLLLGCTKEEFVILGPDDKDTGSFTHGLTVMATNITDTEAEIIWAVSSDLKSDLLTFDIAINDSVIAYDLSNYSYTLTNLAPNSEYKVSVVAYDFQRNHVFATCSIHTMKSFLEDVIALNHDYEYFACQSAIETSDDGILIHAFISIQGYGYYNYLIKLDSQFSVEWEKNIGLVDENPVNALHQNVDESYLVILKKSAIKIDKSGNILWTFTFPAEYEIYEISTALDIDNDGNILMVGYSSKDLGEGYWRMKYFLILLTSEGNEIWHKYGGSYEQSIPHKMLKLDDDELIIFGIAYTQSTSSYWLLKLDIEGNFISEYLYPNNISGNDVPNTIIKHSSGLLLFGTAYGNFYGYENSIQRIIHVDFNGNIIWEKYNRLNLLDFHPTINSVGILNSSTFLVFSSDYEGISIVSIDTEGNVGLNIRVDNYPVSKLIKYTKDGKYAYISDEYIIILNSDGYIN